MKVYEFADGDMQYILNALAKQPFGEVYQLIENIHKQFNEQLELQSNQNDAE